MRSSIEQVNEIEEAVSVSGHGTMVKLSRACQASHLFLPEGKRAGILLKIQIESCSAFNIFGKFEGLRLMWSKPQSRGVLARRDNLQQQRITLTSLVNNQKLAPHALKDIGAALNEITKSEKKLWTIEMAKELVSLNAHVRHATSEENNIRHVLASEANAEFKAILGDGYQLTNESCKADSSFNLGDPLLCLPLQEKCSRQHKTGFRFSKLSGYDNMILLCRPLRHTLSLGTLVMPASAVKIDGISFSLVSNAKYREYLVPDDVLLMFLTNLLQAVRANKEVLTWPSGVSVDISDIKLASYKDLCVPDNVSYAIEHANRLWRERVLPSITISIPDVQGTTVDVFMDGVAVQDKPCINRKSASRPNRQGDSVKLRKNAGRINGVLTERPYEVGDFEALCAFARDKRYFFFIPATVLEEKGILTKQGCVGKREILAYLPDYKPLKGHGADTWTQAYCYDSRDPEVETKIKRVLADIRDARIEDCMASHQSA